jgi:hypothetical protein
VQRVGGAGADWPGAPKFGEQGPCGAGPEHVPRILTFRRVPLRAGNGHDPWLWQGALLAVEGRDAKPPKRVLSAMPSFLARAPPRQ